MDPTFHRTERHDRRGRRLPALVLLLVVALVASSWVGLFGFLGVDAAFGTVEDVADRYLCDVESFDLTFPDLSRLSEVYTADGALLGELTERNSQPVPIDAVPEIVVGAVLSAEDDAFYEHRGADFGALMRAVLANARGGNVQGASTITQQVVKQNFLTAERTIERKVCEIAVAAELERRYTKEEILEFYLNSVFFGSNAYGIRAAAQEYFGKELDELTPAEAATLVVPIRNPTYYHPRKEPANVIEARNRVLDQMAENGWITADEAAAAEAEPLGVIPHRPLADLSPQVMIAVRQELLRNGEYGLGDTYAERKRAIFGCPAADTSCSGGGGLRIYVTVDFDLQQEATRVLQAWFRSGVAGPTGAIATVDNRTGAIRVMASGVEYGTDLAAGQRPYDLATQGSRQPGSAFKPFTLAAALESGLRNDKPITLGTYWDRSSPAEIDCGFPCTDKGDVWTVGNAGGDAEKSVESLRAATYNSRNTVFARLVATIGPEKVVEMAHRLGISSPLKPYPSITLGAFGVSPLEMAAAYSTLASYGVRRDPYLIERIEDADGQVIYQHRDAPRRVLDEALAAAVVGTMRDVVTRGTGRRADLGRPMAGKTGTATDYRDVWFVGFVPQFTTAVWVGYPDAQIPLRDFTVWDDLAGEERYVKRAFGGTVAAPIWKEFMLRVTEGLPPVDFPPEPEGTNRYRTVPRTRVPEITGLDLEEALDELVAVGLQPVVVEVDDLAEAGTVVDQLPLPLERVKEGTEVEVRVSTGVPPEAPLPDLRGLTVEEVEPALTAFTEETRVTAGWIRRDREVADPSAWDRVVATDPAPGTVVGSDVVVVVYIGVPPPSP